MAWLVAMAGALAAASATPAGDVPAPIAPVTTTPAAIAPAAITAPAPEDVDIFQLERERYGRLTVPVTIADQGPFAFMIDTGAQVTVLSRQLADRLGLHERKPAMLIGMASRVSVEVARVEDMALGNRVFDVALAPLLEQRNIGGADGILGLDSLQDQRVLLDFTDHTIAVADAETLGGDRGFEIVVRARRMAGQLVITRAEVDGIRTSVIIDTGAQGSIGNIALRNRLRGRDVGSTTMTDVNGFELEGQLRMIRSLEMDRIQINNFPIAFVDAPPFEVLGLHEEPALILGLEELRLFKRVAIDFPSRRVLFDMPSDTSWGRRASGQTYRFE